MPKVVDPEERRRSVAEAVFRVAARGGLEQASLRNVADEAGLAIGSVRHYFGSHDELLTFAMGVLEQRVQQRLSGYADRVAAAESAADRRTVVEHLLGELLPLDTERHEEAAVWLAFINAARTRPQLASRAREAYDGVRIVVRLVLAGAHAAGRLADGLDIDLETERLAALLDGLATDAVLQPGRMPPDTMIAVLRRHLDSLT
jgi:AcrR family transcriptional regulator